MTREVPADFVFVLEAAQTITHRMRLKECKDAIESFHARSLVLGDRRGPVLVQLPPPLPTASWGYLRLRSVDYDEAALRTRADRIRATSWSDAFVFFKHEEGGTGPRFAAALNEILGLAPPSLQASST